MRCAVLATRNLEFLGNRVFDPIAIQAMRPQLRSMALPWLHVHRVAREHGIRLLTADRAEQEGIDARRVLLVAYDWTPDAARLVARGARPTVLVSFEPSVIAWWLYAHLPRVSARFRHVFLFGGARDRVAASARFHQLYFPVLLPAARLPRVAWQDRRFLVLVNSNKALPRVRDPARWLDRPREVSLKRALAALRYRPIAADRYTDRWRAIEAFARLADFDLYGEGFERRHPAISPRLHARALRAYRGVTQDKRELLSRYRFALVFENTRFPGYVSEKLFDCLFAGAIPVYDGAPDVSRYVPHHVFIDRQRFGTYTELERFLRELPEREAERYREAGQAFLRSPEFQPFSVDTFARELVDMLRDSDG